MPTWRVTDMGNCTIVSLCALLWKQGSAVAVKGSVLGFCDLESYDSASVIFFDNIIKSDVVLCGSKETTSTQQVWLQKPLSLSTDLLFDLFQARHISFQGATVEYDRSFVKI